VLLVRALRWTATLALHVSPARSATATATAARASAARLSSLVSRLSRASIRPWSREMPACAARVGRALLRPSAAARGRRLRIRAHLAAVEDRGPRRGWRCGRGRGRHHHHATRRPTRASVAPAFGAVVAACLCVRSIVTHAGKIAVWRPGACSRIGPVPGRSAASWPSRDSLRLRIRAGRLAAVHARARAGGATRCRAADVLEEVSRTQPTMHCWGWLPSIPVG
jgi:hypothetical protein